MPGTTAAAPTTELDSLREAACEAWIFGLPLIEIASTRANSAGFGGAINTFGHMRNLATHKMRAVTTPNNDTLYTSGQIDLSAGPVTISLPAAGERYLSLALMDAYTNNFAILGTRTTGPDAVTFRLVGPGEAAEGANTLRSPTNHVWALARILVDGPFDLEAARAVQAGISLQGPAAPEAPAHARRSAPWNEYFASVDALMAANPPPITDLALLRRIAPLGLGSGEFDPARFSADQAAAIEAGIAQARTLIRTTGIGGVNWIDGWSYPRSDLGDFGQSYGYRAAVALAGLAALPPVEAMYMRGKGESRGLYDGAKAWRLHFPADRLPAVDSFWSLSLYEATSDGQFFFTDNPLDRYAIGDRTLGLTYNDDGSLDIWIGHEHPGEGRENNWLPAPDSPFALFMRAYLPKAAMLEGAYRLPPVTPA
ncbi:DUF1254 domain-containing protein [Phenylobacterium sp.]|uniref:DUF1254 domain-containing protein n=1 Tax=Phenylobacterium sp. TaxID=1871053 RepID=UPI00289C579C|nr:DUF1254 domain-containing protein [Phenylobacterium sp.]